MWPVGIVRNIRFHDLRHTTGSLLAMAGVGTPALQRILRHRDPRLTMIPWHWDADALAAMSGMRADFALEDIKDTVVVPALSKALGHEDSGSIEAVTIRRAVFEDLRIAFEAEVAVRPPPNGAGRVGAPGTKHILEGFVNQDLTTSIGRRSEART